MKHHTFANIVKNPWDEPCNGTPMFKVSSKLKRLKPELRQLNKKWYINLSLRVKAAREDLVQF